MLAALEDVLDTWPGTLLVVSHDRYFLERVTDQQHAILDGTLRHLPGGVDEYLRMQATGTSGRAPEQAPERRGQPANGAALREAQKELAAIERKLAKLADRVTWIHDRMAAHDQSDYTGLQTLMAEKGEADAELAALEERWLELSDILE